MKTADRDLTMAELEERLVRETENALARYDAEGGPSDATPPAFIEAVDGLREAVAEYRKTHPRSES